LALTIIPFVENIPSILTLEEPENGLHPQAIHTVLEALQLAEKTQLWMSTHSPTVLADFELESIITKRVNASGETEVVKGTEHPRLKDWKKEISLGTLFAAGAFE
jgi:predicted ATPase